MKSSIHPSIHTVHKLLIVILRYLCARLQQLWIIILCTWESHDLCRVQIIMLPPVLSLKKIPHLDDQCYERQTFFSNDSTTDNRRITELVDPWPISWSAAMRCFSYQVTSVSGMISLRLGMSTPEIHGLPEISDDRTFLVSDTESLSYTSNNSSETSNSGHHLCGRIGQNNVNEVQ